METFKLIAEPGKHEAVLEYVLEAPRDLVFKAYVDPQLIPQWWGPRRYITIVEKMEAKNGGSWRYLQRDSDGNTYGFHGVYHLVEKPELVVMTFEYEGMPGHVSLNTIRLEMRNGLTRVIDSTVFQSVADRDGMLKTGMEDGSRESVERLAELLARLSKG